MDTATEMTVDPIAAVDAQTVRFPLRKPLKIGDMSITHREYAVVRVLTEAGLVGKAFVLSRDLPVAEVVRGPLASLLVGQDADAIAARWEQCYRATIPAGRVGIAMRALSLVDIALWDIKAQRAGLPLWRLLGGYQPELPVSMVAGYLTEGTTPEEVAEVVLEHAAAGYDYLKVARSPDPAATDRLLSLVVPNLPERAKVVVDGLWVWRSVREALAELRSWEQHRALGWLEDPFPPERVDLCAALRQACPVPVALGDELSDPNAFHSLLRAQAVDVLRVDATAVGGISTAMRIMHLAAAAGVDVAPHVYPEVHIHCAAAMPGALAVETFDPTGNDFEPSHRFVSGGPTLSAGRLHAPTAPGLGFELDQEMLEAHADPA